jgi:hypothetical protein
VVAVDTAVATRHQPLQHRFQQLAAKARTTVVQVASAVVVVAQTCQTLPTTLLATTRTFSGHHKERQELQLALTGHQTQASTVMVLAVAQVLGHFNTLAV